MHAEDPAPDLFGRDRDGAAAGRRTNPCGSATRCRTHVREVLGRALCIRHVDAGSCNGCELEIHALNNPLYNIEGLGIRFVASPRHADLLLVTGPVSTHMEAALRRTYEAMPDPKLVVAIGDCGCTGGIFGESYASRGRVSNVHPGRCRGAGLSAEPDADPAGDPDAPSAAELARRDNGAQ